jgi:hypothetical protein
MNDFIEDLQLPILPPELNQHVNYDAITHAFTESIEPLQKTCQSRIRLFVAHR